MISVAVRADSSTKVGAGHVMRCLVLARELRRREVAVSFVSKDLPGNLLNKVRDEGFAVHMLPVTLFDVTADAEATLTALGVTPDVVVVDSYELGVGWEARLERTGATVVALDDAPSRRHSCNVLLDQNFGRVSSDYAGLLPGDTVILAGLHYALVRQDILALRPRGPRHRQPGQAHIVISFGGSDATNASAACLEQLVSAGLLKEGRVTVIMGPGASRTERVHQIAEMSDGLVSVLLDPPDYATKLADADVVVGAGGSSMWERCCLAVPSVAIVVAENQREITGRLAAAGVLTLGDMTSVAGDVRALLGDRANWERMSQAAAALVDGEGAKRVATVILEGVWARKRS